MKRLSIIDEIFSVGGTSYLVEKETFYLSKEKIGSLLIFQDENVVRTTANTLSHRLAETGFFAKYTFSDIIHRSESMKAVIEKAKRFAHSEYTVLIQGDSGTGKELIAQSIHNYSGRKGNPFVAINCASLPETLLESELFGYEPGSFTGATKTGKVGLFEKANHGTLFLDEIGDISPKLQSSLLRALQEKQIMRIGSEKIIDVDVRIIAATNADLMKKSQNGEFREDLLYRLNGFTIHLEPLRCRRDDVLPVFESFVGKEMARGGTIFNARGTANAQDEVKFLGVTLHPDKEIVFILTDSDSRNTIMTAIKENTGLTTPGAGIIFSLPVDSVMGIGKTSNDEEKPDETDGTNS